MDKFIKAFNPVVLAVSSAWSLATIEQTLSIVILVINIAWVLFTIGFKIYRHIKDGSIETIGDDLKEGANALEQLREKEKTKDE